MTGPYPADVVEKFKRNLKQNEATGCLEWQAGKLLCRGGYGQINVGQRGGKSVIARVHRVAWELAKGPIPAGLCVLHRCDNPSCANVEHLFLGGHGDNNLDMITKGRHGQSKKTHCPNGHPYVGDNVYTYKRKEGWTTRQCRTCHLIASAKHKARRRGQS